MFKPRPDNGVAPEQLPCKPDARTQPALSSAWERMFEPPLNWVSPELEPLHSLIDVRLRRFQRFSGLAATRIEKSSNWSGATIVPDGGRQFVSVFGEWDTPVPSVPTRQLPSERYFSATWIGLDGDRRYLDSSMPQVGTQQDITRGGDGQYAPVYYAWFQWWAPRRLRSTSAFQIKGIEVRGGSPVMGLVWAFAPKQVIVLFRNFSPNNQITYFFQEVPEYDLRVLGEPVYRPTISGATAEWIVERPTVEIEPTQDPPDLEPFADYKEVTFRHCVAGMAPKPGDATAEKVLTAPRFKRMYEILPNASRTGLISMPERGTSLTELRVKYGGFESK